MPAQRALARKRRRRSRAVLLIPLALASLSLAGCEGSESFRHDGSLAWIGSLLRSLVGAGAGSGAGGVNLSGVNTSFTQTASLTPSTYTTYTNGGMPNVAGAANPGLFGGLFGADSPVAQPGAGTTGVLNLPLLRQGDGGWEAGKRGCGPASLLMATGRGNPAEIQPVLEVTCARPGGLIASKAVDWLQANGYRNAQHYTNWTVDMLREETMIRRNPVVINFKNPRTGNGHIVVVTGVTAQGVHVNDPGPGIREVHSVARFQELWAVKDEYAIPVRV